MVSVIIVNWNVKDLLEKCLKSIDGYGYEIIVVDNASADGSAQMIRQKFPQVKLIENKENRGFSAANNQGIRQATGKYILLLNPDTEVKLGAIEVLVKFLEDHPQAGAVAPKLMNSDGTLQRSVLSFPTLSAMLMRAIFVESLWPGNPATRKYLMRDLDYSSVSAIDQPMGAAILISKSVLDQVGLFDEQSFMFFDEVDLCKRIKDAGSKIFFTPQAEIVHHLSKSVQKWGVFNLSRNWTRSRNLYFLKHQGPLALAALYLIDLLRISLFLVLILFLFLLLFRLFR